MTFLEKLESLSGITDLAEMQKASYIIPDENLREALVWMALGFNTYIKSDETLLHKYTEENERLKKRVQELEQQLQELS